MFVDDGWPRSLIRAAEPVPDADAPTHAMSRRLREQSNACARMGSPLYGALLQSAALDYENGGAVRAFYDADLERVFRSRTGLRLLAAFHYCALEGNAPNIARHFPACGGDGDAMAAWSACREFLERDSNRIGALHERILPNALIESGAPPHDAAK